MVENKPDYTGLTLVTSVNFSGANCGFNLNYSMFVIFMEKLKREKKETTVKWFHIRRHSGLFLISLFQFEGAELIVVVLGTVNGRYSEMLQA